MRKQPEKPEGEAEVEGEAPLGQATTTVHSFSTRTPAIKDVANRPQAIADKPTLHAIRN